MLDMGLKHLPDETDVAKHDAARRALIRELQSDLQTEIEEAHKEIDKVRRASKTVDVHELEAVKHRYRRSIAGYDQAIELLKQGTGDLRTAIGDGLIIFKGHSYVFLLS